MKSFYAGLLFVVAMAAAGCAPMGLSASMQVRSAPPPPHFEFNSEPRFSYLSDLRIAVIADDGFGYDMFRCGGSFYLYNGDNWYRSQSSRGPFVAVEVRRVPRPIFDVDDRQYRWRSHPAGWRAGQMKEDRRDGHDDRRGEKRERDGR